MSTATTTSMPSAGADKKLGKYAFWTVMGLAGISVLIWTDYPLLHTPSDYRTKLVHDHLFLIPHAIAGVLATVLGPFQFSTRLRQRHLAWHRLMGKVYAIAVCLAAPMVILLSRGFSALDQVAGDAQASIWLLCTVCAFLTARNRQITVHRQWMIRSYAFTLNFIFSRVLNPIPAYFNLSENAFSAVLFLLTIIYLVVTDVAFSWRELTHKRA
jgi:uncharacterized membrane protein